MMLKEPVSDSVVRRLPRYYRYLSELERAGVERTSSQALATQLGSTASQIRQDLNCFGGFGHQGYGYHVSDLRTQLGRIIGLEQCMPAVLIGAGHLGSVIAVNIDFPAYGFYLTGIFDIVPTVCGQVLGGLTVQHMTQLSDFCEQVHPAAAVHGFWNFSHCDLEVDRNTIQVENVHLGDSLMALSYRLHQDGGNE